MKEAIAVICALAACGGRAEKSGGEPARIETVTRGDIVERQLMTGELHAASSIALTVPRTDTWQLAISWLPEDGATVKQGDKVLEFDNSAFTAQLAEKHLAMLEAEMSLRGVQNMSAIETASKDMALREHQIALAKATVRAGVPAELLPGRDAQERQLEKKRAEAAVEKATREQAAQRKQAALEAEVKQIELDKARRAIEAAEQTIADLVVTAPRDGLFIIADHPWLGRKVRLRDTMQPGMTVASLPDMTEAMEVRAELSDVDDGRVKVGMTGSCTLDAFPREPIACTVKDLMPVARSKGEGSLRRTFALVLTLDKSDPARTRPGMSVAIELHPHTVPGALLVPRGAIASHAAKPGEPGARVRMASGELREVTLGACDARACAALHGLASGDRVAVGGTL